MTGEGMLRIGQLQRARAAQTELVGWASNVREPRLTPDVPLKVAPGTFEKIWNILEMTQVLGKEGGLPFPIVCCVISFENEPQPVGDIQGNL